MHMTHLILWVQENKLSEKFYKKLGFEAISSDDDHSLVTLNGCMLDLVSMRDEEPFTRDALAGDKGRGMYICIHTDTIDGLYAELEKRNLSPTKPKDWPWGNREFVVKDPDGYKLCFWQKSSQV